MENIVLGSLLELKNGCVVEVIDVLDTLDNSIVGEHFWSCTLVSGDVGIMEEYKHGDWDFSSEYHYYLITENELKIIEIMKYYDVQIEFPRGGYSICVATQKDLTEEEIINLIPQNKFEEKGDRELIDSIEEIDKEQAFEWFGKNRIIKL